MRSIFQKAQQLVPLARRTAARPASQAPQRPVPTVRPDVFQAGAQTISPRDLAQFGPQRPPVPFIPVEAFELIDAGAKQMPSRDTGALLEQLREAVSAQRAERLGAQLRELPPRLRLAHLEQALGTLTDAQKESLLELGGRAEGTGGTQGDWLTEMAQLPDREVLERALAKFVAPAEPTPYDGPTFDGVTPAEGTTNTQAGLPVDAPLTNAPGDRSPAAYEQVINQFAVGNNPRYAIRDSSGDGVADTFCNIFASDVMDAMGVELPHWVNADGSPAEPYAPGARELSANGGHAWLETHGATYGWREVSAEEAQASANQGLPTVVSMEQPGGIGHIAVVRPGEVTADGPTIAQAGLVNTNQTHVNEVFGEREVKYYVNDQGGAAGTGGAPTSASPTLTNAVPGTGAGALEGPSVNAPSERPTAPPEGLERGNTGEDVLALQHVLVAEGYLTEEQLATGPGTFGPRTEAALLAYQQANGLPVTGYYGPMTAASMRAGGTPAMEATQAESVLDGPGTGGRAQVDPPGSEGGAIRRNVPYISQLSSEGAEDDWNAQSNCGPTSMAMIARTFGYGDGMSDGALVNSLGGSVGITEAGIGWPGVVAMAEGIGLSAEHRSGNDLSWIDAQLEQGNLIAANGNRIVTAQNSSHNDGYGGGHWIVVIGKDADGNYLVQDPSTDCKVLTPAELQRFFDAREPDGGHMVAVGP